jgi:ribosomal protein S18 acetylase RimI-like enzyme
LEYSEERAMMLTMSAEVVIREATERDLEQVVRVLHAANAEFEATLPAPFYRAYLANVLDVRGRLDESELFVAERANEGDVVATITFYPKASDEGWGWPPNWTGIRAVAVRPSERGLGIGKRLAETCIARSRELGADAVALHTASFMQAAMRLYESVGFRRAPAFDRDAGALFGLPHLDPPITALAYTLEL